MANIANCHIPVAVNINFNHVKGFREIKFAKDLYFKQSGPSQEGKSVFSDNH